MKARDLATLEESIEKWTNKTAENDDGEYDGYYHDQLVERLS